MRVDPEGNVTVLLRRWAEGDARAFEALLPVVYEELRRLARLHMRHENPGHTFQPTDLVHEAYLRLSGVRDMGFANRAHFYGAAAQVMRRVLVDHSRRRRAGKRAAAIDKVSDLDVFAGGERGPDLARLDDALDALEKIAPEKAKVVELRYFGGLSIEEAGEYMGLSPATVKRYWTFARAWLFRELSRSESS